MGIIDRIKLNLKANLNYALDKAEDPQKIFDLFLMEVRESIQEFKESITSAVAGIKRLERELSDSAEKANQWQERAELALKKNHEGLAKKALEQKLVYTEREKSLKVELEKQKRMVEELKADLSTLEAKLDELYQKRVDLIKRYMQLRKETTQQALVRGAGDRLGIDTGVFDTYEDMMKKVQALEDQASALSELEEADKLEREFKKLEREAIIESELKAMKGNV